MLYNENDLTNEEIETLIAVDAYLRYSDHKQDEGNSIEYQMSEINEYCAANGMYVRNWYIDRAASGKKVAGRDDFYSYMETVKNGTASKHIVVWRTNRFFRNSYESHKYRKMLRDHKIKLISVTQTIDEETSSGRMITGILSEIDEYKSAEISEHVTSSMRYMVKKGFYIGSPIPLGYELEDCFDGDKARKRYVVDTQKAEFVKHAFEMYLGGMSTLQIAEYLNGAGICNAAGNAFDGNAVSRLLHNEFYIGTRIYETKSDEPIRIEKRHEPIISESLFNAVQDRFAERLEHRAVAGRLSRSRRVYALTGKITCGKCGNPYFGKSSRNKTKTAYPYYVCRGRVQHKTCNCAGISKATLENYVLSQIKTHLLSDAAIDAVANHVLGAVKKSAKPNYDKASLTKRKSTIISELSDLAQMKIKKEIVEEVYFSMKRNYEDELSSINARLENLELSSKTTIDYDFIKDYIKKLLRDSESADPNIIKALFKELVKDIVIDDSKVTVSLAISFERYVHKGQSGFPSYVLCKQITRTELK